MGRKSEKIKIIQLHALNIKALVLSEEDGKESQCSNSESENSATTTWSEDDEEFVISEVAYDDTDGDDSANELTLLTKSDPLENLQQ